MENKKYILEKLAGFSNQSIEKAILNRISKIKALENAEAQKNLLLKTDSQISDIANSVTAKLMGPYGLYNRKTGEKLEKFIDNSSKVRKLIQEGESIMRAGGTMADNKPLNILANMTLRDMVRRNKAQELKKAIKKELPLLQLLTDYKGSNPARTTALDELRNIHYTWND